MREQQYAVGRAEMPSSTKQQTLGAVLEDIHGQLEILQKIVVTLDSQLMPISTPPNPSLAEEKIPNPIQPPYIDIASSALKRLTLIRRSLEDIGSRICL